MGQLAHGLSPASHNPWSWFPRCADACVWWWWWCEGPTPATQAPDNAPLPAATATGGWWHTRQTRQRTHMSYIPSGIKSIIPTPAPAPRTRRGCGWGLCHSRGHAVLAGGICSVAKAIRHSRLCVLRRWGMGAACDEGRDSRHARHKRPTLTRRARGVRVQAAPGARLAAEQIAPPHAARVLAAG